MLGRIVFVFGLLAAALLSPSEARAERRVALVIGNAQYAHAPGLRNARNDATDMAESLTKLGFEVVLGLDLDQRGFAAHIDRFARALDGAAVALFYYAGHGLQLNEKNYLISTNAQLSSEFLVSSETIELDAVIRLMESRSGVNLVFLDACRNNPLAEDLRRNLTAQRRSVSLGRGLARVEPSGRDTLVAFAAAPGQEAGDGDTRNSPFTGALLRHIATPGQEVSVMLKEVAAEVRRGTGNTQRPQQLSDMTRTFYFAKAEQAAAADAGGRPEPSKGAMRPPAPAVAAEPADRTLDVAFWNAAQSANDCDAVRAYLARFPNGVFVELAKISERRLCAARVALVEPPATSSTLTPQPPSVAPAPSAAAAPAATPVPPAVVASPPPIATNESKVAAAPGVPPAPTVTTIPPQAPAPELARAIQTELVRVGCSTEAADGTWSPAAQEAMQRFNEHARWRFDTSTPSPLMLAALQRSDGRICPLECERGFEARGNTCVAVAPPPAPPRKKAERTREKPREQRSREQKPREQKRPAATQRREARPAPPRQQARTQRAAPAASGESGFLQGGRRCRIVPRPTGGGFNGDTVTVCD